MESFNFNPTIAKQQATNDVQITNDNLSPNLKNPILNKVAVATINNTQNNPKKELADCEVKEIKLKKAESDSFIEDSEGSEDQSNEFNMEGLDFLSDAIFDVTQSLEQLNNDESSNLYDLDFLSEINSDVIQNEGQEEKGEEVVLLNQDAIPLDYLAAAKLEEILKNIDDLKILNEMLSDPQKTISNAKIFEFKDGKLKTTSADKASVKELLKATEQDKLLFIVKDKVYLSPSCGLKRGKRLNVKMKMGIFKS